ncbi:hypothetical protein HKX48_008684 [Thoreauomyces humboldtii]|nr:hypothetical protein HKX48_008684 [Thoreauomyces humboldtii]
MSPKSETGPGKRERLNDSAVTTADDTCSESPIDDAHTVVIKSERVKSETGSELARLPSMPLSSAVTGRDHSRSASPTSEDESARQRLEAQNETGRRRSTRRRAFPQRLTSETPRRRSARVSVKPEPSSMPSVLDPEDEELTLLADGLMVAPGLVKEEGEGFTSVRIRCPQAITFTIHEDGEETIDD